MIQNTTGAMKKRLYTCLLLVTALTAFGCGQTSAEKEISMDKTVKQGESAQPSGNRKKATFGAGCFWCVEAVFEKLKGVESVVSGYAGGTVADPSYEEVCSGTTGHAEVCQITYDPGQITYEDLLEVFWKTHDPTTLNQQGADMGTQYRSAVFYHSDKQKQLAEEYKQKLDKAGIWNKPIVTEISPLTTFYKAEDYHQDYYERNTNQPYCLFTIKPKVDKVNKIFKDKLK